MGRNYKKEQCIFVLSLRVCVVTRVKTKCYRIFAKMRKMHYHLISTRVCVVTRVETKRFRIFAKIEKI
jgi:hypothetical protein